MTGFIQDLRYSLRVLRSAPGFTLVAVATLALGIGATSAIFSLIHIVLLKPLPFPEPDRIVTPISVQTVRGIRDGGVAYADYLDWRKQTDVFQYLALWRPQSLDLTGGDRPERVRALAVTGEYFAGLSTTATVGRTFDASAEAPGERPTVLSDGAWRRLFGGNPDAIGRTVYLSGIPHIIVGVIPTHLAWPTEIDAFVPLRLDPARDQSLLRRDNFVFRAIGRLQAGATIGQARARVAALASSVAQQFPESRKAWTYDIVSLHEYTVGDDFRLALLVLCAAVGLVLLIACANVANLLLARGTDRWRELAVRAALGASRPRLLRALLVENLSLAAAGGAAGLILAHWMSRALVTIAPDDMPIPSTPALNWQMVAFTVVATFGTAFLFGLLPAYHGSGIRPHDAMNQGARAGTSARTGRIKDILVTAEMTLSVVLLVTAALTIRSLLALGRVDPGVDVENVLTARLIVPSARYPDPDRRLRFYQELVERVARLPGVRSAAVTSRLPAGGPGLGLGRVFLAEGQSPPPASNDFPAQWTVVGPEYFATLGMRLIQGRPFTAHDNAKSTPVIVVSERLAKQMFPGQSPLGKRIRSWRDENRLREIVGVVADVRYLGLADRPRNVVYVPHAQDTWGTMMLAVKTTGDSMDAVNAVRAEVTALDPMLALGDVGALATYSAESVDGTRFTARLLGAFAVLALVLAIIGVYGVMAYAVSRRAHEIGVRLALGAQRRDVARLVIGKGIVMAAIGLASGAAAAAAIAQTLRASLPEIGPFDPLAFGAATTILFAAALAACAVPALRAMKLDPAEVLRQQ